MSGAPDLEQHVDQNQRQTCPNRQDYFFTIVSDDGHIVLDLWIAIEELVSLAKNHYSATQKTKDGNAEGDSQSRNAGLFNHCYQNAVCCHVKRVVTRLTSCYEASEGFCNATEGWTATPSSGINVVSPS
jgi:hypothetical protein